MSNEASHSTPSLGRSIWIGAQGFTLLGLAGFLPWALGTGRWLGEAGMFALCAIVFIALSGPLLHRLTPGPGSVWRFQKLFTGAFFAYAIVWSLVWFLWRFHLNDYLGLVLGTFVFAVIVAWKFGRWDGLAAGFLGLATFHGVGYWIGDEIHIALRAETELDLGALHFNARQCAIISKLAWGVFYGLGFGAGIGWLFGLCQPRSSS